MKYIDAEKLKAEIERHIKEIKEAENRFHPNLGFFDAKLSGIYDVMNIIDSLQQEQPVLPGIEDPGIPGKDFIPVEWVDACEKYGKWKIVNVEQPEVDLEKEMEKFGECWPYPASFDGYDKDWVDELAEECAKHFYELGKKDMKRKMMEGAVEGVVNHGTAVSYVISDEDQLDERLKQFQNDAEVRIIILPKED